MIQNGKHHLPLISFYSFHGSFAVLGGPSHVLCGLLPPKEQHHILRLRTHNRISHKAHNLMRQILLFWNFAFGLNCAPECFLLAGKSKEYKSINKNFFSSPSRALLRRQYSEALPIQSEWEKVVFIMLQQSMKLRTGTVKERLFIVAEQAHGTTKSPWTEERS